MSFNVAHDVSKRFGAETLVLRVYADGSATFAIVENEVVGSMRSLDPDEDGADIALSDDAREWFDAELAAGREDAYPS